MGKMDMISILYSMILNDFIVKYLLILNLDDTLVNIINLFNLIFLVWKHFS